jgi:hypothetical protein
MLPPYNFFVVYLEAKMKHSNSTWVAVVLVSITVFASSNAAAYTILAPDSTVGGKSIAEWTAAWWTWALQVPATQNPLADTTGAFANVNNNGPVFFVAGTNGLSGPVTRSFAISAGRPVLIPLINFFDTEPAEIDPPTATLDDRKNAVDVVVAGWLNAVKPTTLFASIDGNPVANVSQYLEVTGLFSMGPTQAGSVVASLGVPVGAELFPSKAAGYWLMIEGLSPGPHTLRFGGSSGAFTPAANCCTTSEISAFSTETTAHIVPEPAAWLVIMPALVVVFGMSFARRRYS